MEQGGPPARHKVVLNRMTARRGTSVAAKAVLDVLRNADAGMVPARPLGNACLLRGHDGAVLYEPPPDRDGSVARAQNTLRAVADELLSDFLSESEDQAEAATRLRDRKAAPDISLRGR